MYFANAKSNNYYCFGINELFIVYLITNSTLLTHHLSNN